MLLDALEHGCRIAEEADLRRPDAVELFAVDIDLDELEPVVSAPSTERNCSRVPTASTTSAFLQSACPPGSSWLSGWRSSSTPRPRR
jgi:hypothetical protein